MDSAPDRIIEIYLPAPNEQVALLSIPESDIRRLSNRPFKWMRFVMFCICGTQGDLSATSDGPLIDYEGTSLSNNKYYYKPSGDYTFVDPSCLRDRVTSISTQPARNSDFRTNIMQRDGWICVVTRGKPQNCDTAHLIPRNKGNEYINRVFDRRTQCYDPPQPPRILDIDAVENGVFLRKDLHSQLGHGDAVFLKTPNFAMDPTDISRVKRGPHGDHITFQQLDEPSDYNRGRAQNFLGDEACEIAPHLQMAYALGVHVDALFPGATDELCTPPAIILDFMYGAAAYKRWRNGSIHSALEAYYEEHYKSIPVLPPPPDADEDKDKDKKGDTPDDPNDSDYRPPSKKQRHLSERGDSLADAMDEMNLVMMFCSGITPQEAAKMQEKRMEEEELKAQEVSRTKVTEWKNAIGLLTPPL